ncbi:cbb3-type cytochrome oxidase subunit 3, partial [Sphingorhabdus sp.]|uniref:cbb3-type cytochrome oxidase subunit 3 n=1 Tax=Sphingorhabdus sp. TaxID=1902408 RepID=UPI00391B3EFC
GLRQCRTTRGTGRGEGAMSLYEQLRHFADSYALVAIFVVFLGLCAWPFRPGARTHNHNAAHSIFKDQDDGE